MKVDLAAGRVLRPPRDLEQERQIRERMQADRLRLERERRIPTRLAGETDVPVGSILSEAMQTIVRTGGIGLKGYAPLFLSPDAHHRLAAANAKRGRRRNAHNDG